jgi:hypothetical protein
MSPGVRLSASYPLCSHGQAPKVRQVQAAALDLSLSLPLVIWSHCAALESARYCALKLDCARGSFWLTRRQSRWRWRLLRAYPCLHAGLGGSRSGPSIKSKARLVGLMSQLGGGYDELVKMREADKRKKEAEKTKKPPQRRVRLPRVKPKGEN